MDAREAAENLATIRRIMESAAELTVMPGKAAIIGGLLALGGCGATYWQLGSLDFGDMGQADPSARRMLVAVWSAVAVLAMAIDVMLTVAAARKRGRSPWSRLSQMAAYAMGPGILAGVAITLALAQRNDWAMAPGIWMMLYGGAVWMASVMSIRAPSVFGLLFFLAGALTLFVLPHVSLAMVGLTFGLGHIVFGVYLIKKFGD